MGISKAPEDIILEPKITEKRVMMAEEGKYTFVVNKDSNKTEIKKAVEELFNVKVKKVGVMNCIGKKKRARNSFKTGRTPCRKVAIVTIDTNPNEKNSGKKYNDSIQEFSVV